MERKEVQQIIDRKKGWVKQETEQAYEMLQKIKDYIDEDLINLAIRQLNYLSLNLMDLRDDKESMEAWEQILEAKKEED